MTHNDDYSAIISSRLAVSREQVKETVSLLDNGASIPFIARYRKEATGSLDEIAVSAIKDLLHTFSEIDARRQAIINSLEKNDHLTPDLSDQLACADSLASLEDLYLPYRPKRKTRAAKARERGLEPLARLLFKQNNNDINFHDFTSSKLGVVTKDDARDGACDIIAEIISEDQKTRQEMRSLFKQKAIVRSQVVTKNKEQGSKYQDYFDWQEPVKSSAGHRLLALFRGESQGFLKLTLKPEEQIALNSLFRRHLRPSRYRPHVKKAIEDSYKRLLAPSLENELRKELKEQSDRESIKVFSNNLRELLLAPPIGGKRVLALDPGYRSGAKLVCLDKQGQLLHNTTIYPTQGAKQEKSAAETVKKLVKRYDIEAVAIGNGTASRETEQFVNNLELTNKPIITLVNEDGASIYSASKQARKEFPDLDLTVRGAISIGRRLQDPLAELVKIDPKSIGVGQYQHDVDQKALKHSLDEVISSCVNGVGVELNTASAELLSHVSGLGPTLADNIIDYRNTFGPFKNRKELLKVPRLGEKAFELCAGFLRIRHGDNILDGSGVHPERYSLVEKIAADLNTRINDLISSETIRQGIVLENYISPAIGRPTLEDIISELEKPGRDPRAGFHEFCFAEYIHTINDIEVGMTLPAVITNVTNFGAFADIGVHQDGLIHISQLADQFVKDPTEIVRVRQQVQVRVLEVDLHRKRISLSMKSE